MAPFPRHRTTCGGWHRLIFFTLPLHALHALEIALPTWAGPLDMRGHCSRSTGQSDYVEKRFVCCTVMRVTRYNMHNNNNVSVGCSDKVGSAPRAAHLQVVCWCGFKFFTGVTAHFAHNGNSAPNLFFQFMPRRDIAQKSLSFSIVKHCF